MRRVCRVKKPEEAHCINQHPSLSRGSLTYLFMYIYIRMYVRSSLLMGHIGRYDGSGTIGLDFLWIFFNQLRHLLCRKRRNNPFSPLLHRAIE